MLSDAAKPLDDGQVAEWRTSFTHALAADKDKKSTLISEEKYRRCLVVAQTLGGQRYSELPREAREALKSNIDDPQGKLIDFSQRHYACAEVNGSTQLVSIAEIAKDGPATRIVTHTGRVFDDLYALFLDGLSGSRQMMEGVKSRFGKSCPERVVSSFLSTCPVRLPRRGPAGAAAGATAGAAVESAGESLGATDTILAAGLSGAEPTSLEGGSSSALVHVVSLAPPDGFCATDPAGDGASRGPASVLEALAAASSPVPAAAPSAAPKRGSKRKREFDMGRYAQRHVALRIVYDGRQLSGLAVQADTPDTVEAILFSALERTRLITSPTACGYSRGGRTDKGVSATGQVVALWARSNAASGLGVRPAISQGPPVAADGGVRGGDSESPQAKRGCDPQHTCEIDYVGVLNNTLPPSVRVVGWCPVDEKFDARFSAVSRTYKYFFLRGNLDTHRMDRAAALFKGTHDFRNFCKVERSQPRNLMRTIMVSTVVSAAPANGVPPLPTDVVHFHVQGRGFLWHQVRCMMAVLFLVGRGDEEPDVVRMLLDAQQVRCKPQYDMASDAGLVLTDIAYEPPLTFTAAKPDCEDSVAAEGLRPSLLRDCIALSSSAAAHAGFIDCLQQEVTRGQGMAMAWPRADDGLRPRGGKYTPLLHRPRGAPLPPSWEQAKWRCDGAADEDE